MAFLDTLSDEILRKMFPAAGDRLTPHLPFIVPAMREWDIATPNRAVAFLAQLAHESGEYRYMQELASGDGYEGRLDLGNTEPGDGRKYKGHGPIQITGRDNHIACGSALGIDLETNPLLLTLPEYGTKSACWFWSTHNLNPISEQNWFKLVTRIINGGVNGLTERIMYWSNNRQICDLEWVDVTTEDKRIKDFQTAHGLVADGQVGPRTLNALRSVA